MNYVCNTFVILQLKQAISYPCTKIKSMGSSLFHSWDFHRKKISDFFDLPAGKQILEKHANIPGMRRALFHALPTRG